MVMNHMDNVEAVVKEVASTAGNQRKDPATDGRQP